MKTLKFTKMYGLGNDFMVISGIGQTFEPKEALLSAWSNRFRSVNFDQLLLVERPSSKLAGFRYRISNAGGGEVGQCDDETRCFVHFVADEGSTDKKGILVETADGMVVPRLLENGLVTINMDQPRFTPSETPFVSDSREDSDTLTHIILVGLESAPISCMNVDNPHAVIIMEGTETTPVGQWGEAIGSHEQFPERVNIKFMQIINHREVRLRVYEHGTGETRACGTDAYAAVVADVRLGLLDAGESIKVVLPGGDLLINWALEGGVMITGPAETVFEGELQY